MKIAYFADANCIHSYQWIKRFSEDNEVILFCIENQKDNLYKHNSTVTVYPILPQIYPLLRKFWIKKKVAKQIKDIIKQHDIQIVHSMFVVPYSFWASLAQHPEHIITTRGSDILRRYNIDYKNPESFIKRIIFTYKKYLFEEICNQAKYITSTSATQQKILKQFISHTEKLKLIRTGVDVDAFESVYRKLETKTDKTYFTILSPRLIKPLYNVDLIIDAFYLLSKKHPELKIKLVLIDYLSERDYLSYIEKKITTLSLENKIEILPPKNIEDMPQVYKNADAVIMLPKSDGTPVSGIETMLAKKPLIIGNIDYDDDIFNENTVWKTHSFNPEDICNTISDVLFAPQEILMQKIQNAYNTVIEKANMKKEMAKVAKLYGLMLNVKNSTEEEIQTCSQCLLNTNDVPNLAFNEWGICKYCLQYESVQNYYQHEKENKLHEIIQTVKTEGQGKKYDCILGVSGGVDSTYIAYLAKQFGLRPLIVHYDNGWNSELAVKNIENVVEKLGFDLYTYVNDWEEFKDIQLAFFKASVIDIELITDQAIVAILLQIARKNKVKYIIQGCNISTEAILPENWYHWKLDVLNIKAIHQQFGTLKMKTYPYLDFWERWYFDKFLKIQSIPLLNYVDYDKEKAKKIITEELGWRDYGGKHHESIFTRFYQAYILPQKFGVDKRKAHLSTLVCSGQITREQAIKEMQMPLYDEAKLQEDKTFVLKKLGLSEEEFDRIMKMPVKSHMDYPSYLTRHYRYQKKFSDLIKPVKNIFKK